jgi:hypothetical protein
VDLFDLEFDFSFGQRRNSVEVALCSQGATPLTFAAFVKAAFNDCKPAAVHSSTWGREMLSRDN